MKIRNSEYYEIVKGLASKGNVVSVPDEVWQARRNESEIRAVSAGCKPISEIKQVATEVEGWRAAK